MKKQKILAFVLGLSLVAGTVVESVSPRVYADQGEKNISASKSRNLSEEDGLKDYLEAYVKKGVISKEEAEKVILGEKVLDDLYKNPTNRNKESVKLDSERDKLLEDVLDIYNKIEEYKHYNDLKENKILNKEELEIYKKARKEIHALYEKLPEADLCEDRLDNVFKAEEKIMDEHKAVFDKVAQYLEDSIPYEEAVTYPIEDDYFLYNPKEEYEELAKKGIISKMELEKLKNAESKIEQLYKESKDKDLTDKEFDLLYLKVNTIFESNRTILDKIDAYYDSLYEKELNDELGSLVNKGILSQEELQDLVKVEKDLDDLYKAYEKKNITEKEIFEIDEKAKGLFEANRNLYNKLDILYKSL